MALVVPRALPEVVATFRVPPLIVVAACALGGAQKRNASRVNTIESQNCGEIG
jgi:hypothetical protein